MKDATRQLPIIISYQDKTMQIILCIFKWKANNAKLTLSQYIITATKRRLQKIMVLTDVEYSFMKKLVIVYQIILLVISAIYLISQDFMLLYIVQIMLIGDAYILGNMIGIQYFKV